MVFGKKRTSDLRKNLFSRKGNELKLNMRFANAPSSCIETMFCSSPMLGSSCQRSIRQSSSCGNLAQDSNLQFHRAENIKDQAYARLGGTGHRGFGQEEDRARARKRGIPRVRVSSRLDTDLRSVRPGAREWAAALTPGSAGGGTAGAPMIAVEVRKDRVPAQGHSRSHQGSAPVRISAHVPGTREVSKGSSRPLPMAACALGLGRQVTPYQPAS